MKYVIVAFIALLGAVGAGAYWWYLVGPRAVAERWIQCGVDRKALLTERDQQFWDEARKPGGDEHPLAITDEACLGERTIEAVEIKGLRAIVKVKERLPELSWKEMTEFPAAATRPEKVALLRDRASKAAKVVERSLELLLVLEQLRWRIALNLEKTVLVERQFRTAQDHRKKGAFAQAIAIYDAVLSGLDLTEPLRQRSTRERLEAVAEKACVAAARQYLKFPEASDYRLQGIGHAVSDAKILVVGDILAPNAFGVQGKYTTNCNVTFFNGKSQVSIDLLMIPTDDPASPINKKNIELIP